jgi:2-polyprenyl-6-hydroxyphenyl methylase/3-demethylubiquinone-9 3-methyltransferase
MRGYYADNLSSIRLKKVYDIAPPRVLQYLDAEIRHVLEFINQNDLVLELGCGYGRVIPDIVGESAYVVGIDNSEISLKYAADDLKEIGNCRFAGMNGASLGFKDNTFDVVVCIQNGISAFHVDQETLIREAVRATRRGGFCLFSSYSDKFWNDRLHWFELQSREGLLGEIDYEKTGDGIIVCKDGFKAITVSKEKFRELTDRINGKVNITEVDNSSVFCEIRVINNHI